MHAELRPTLLWTFMEYENWHFYKFAKWQLKFVWLPERCDKSNRLLWFTYAYRGDISVNTLVDAGMSKVKIPETRWLRKQEYIFGKIAGTI